MSALLFADQENVGLRVPPNKDRLRLKSAPELQGGRVFKTPCAPFTPLPRPALGSIRKATHTHTPLSSGTHTPNVRLQRDALLRCREKEPQQHVEDEEPEKMFPYSPDGLPWQPVIPETDEITLEPCEPLAPFYSEDYATELDDFLLTIDELIVDLPPPPEDPLDL
ncbi:securin isoform X2 [Sardina pilchardus]|uniref:securin isoform X2 n=1 Tax=Sardina pilchardus TaxID=27697 RepID=UPI002E105AE6